jgi:MazG family protein
MQHYTAAFEKLVTIIKELREKCPWDKKQTIHTLRQMTIEETYELAEAIDTENWQHIKEELGDVLLHLLFYTQIATEQHQFNLENMLQAIAQKLINRHPHIYENVVVADAEEVKKNWEQIKLAEGKTSILSGVPTVLPSLLKAMRLQEKAKQVGFEWENKEQVWEKVEEEIAELKEAITIKDIDKQEEELGDVLFSIVNYARFLNLDADKALETTNKKFMHRFTQMEAMASNNNTTLATMSLPEMEAMWNAVKHQSASH